jgi:hypothetical protein
MTLIFKKLIRNSLLAQMKIQHVDANVQVFKRGEIPEFVTEKMQELWGENFGLDGDYWIFFSSPTITKKIADTTLFNVVNSALGRAANDMKEGEIRVFDFSKGGVPKETPDETSDDADLVDDGAEEANEEATADALSESVQDPQPNERFAFVKVTMR